MIVLLLFDVDINHEGVITYDEVMNYLNNKKYSEDINKLFNGFASKKLPKRKNNVTFCSK